MECKGCKELPEAETLLVVDDDDEIRELLCDYLSESGYRVLAAADGKEMWQLLEQHSVQLLILDLMLPGEDGLSLCRRLQSREAPSVIMLSARGSAIDRIVGLEVGADDYLSKPFEPRELLARVKAVLRRSAPALATAPPGVDNGTPERFGDYRLEHAKRALVFPDGRTLLLPRSDYRVICELVAARDRVLSRDHLTRRAFGRPHLPDDRSVDMCISRLRQHFKSSQCVQILTVRNEGYLFIDSPAATD